MARTGWGAANFLRASGAPVTAAPLTLSIWFNMAVSGGTRSLMGLFNSGSTGDANLFSVKQSADAIQATTADTTFSNAVTSTTTTATGVWHHACAVFASATDRRAFLNGGGKGTNATSRVPSGIDRASIGLRDDVGGGQVVLSGTLLAEAAIWNIDLTDAEVALLGKGIHPFLIRPQNLVAYWPEVRNPDNDWVGGYNFTVQGSLTVAAHPPVMLPPLFRIGGVRRPPPPPTVTTSLDAALQKTVAKTASIDAALQKAFTKTASLDGALLKVLTKTTSLDAALQMLGVVRTASLDAALQKAFSVSGSLDAALQKALSLTAGFDAALLKEGVIKTAAFDAALAKSMAIQASLDAQVVRQHTITAGMDAFLYPEITTPSEDRRFRVERKSRVFHAGDGQSNTYRRPGRQPYKR